MTMLVTGYTSKKELKASIGETLSYEETSMFGPEYKSTGSFVVAPVSYTHLTLPTKRIV